MPFGPWGLGLVPGGARHGAARDKDKACLECGRGPPGVPPSSTRLPSVGPLALDKRTRGHLGFRLTTAALFCIWRKGTSLPSPRGPCDSWQEKPLAGAGRC